MSRARWGVALGITVLSSLAAARPVPIRHPPSRSSRTGEGRSGRPQDPPLRVIIQKRANCVFAAQELPERAGGEAPIRDEFREREPIFGRCFLPDRIGSNRPKELVDVIIVDGKKAWEQAYDQPVPSDARSRLVAYSELLRTLFANLQPGPHRVRVEGQLRQGGRTRPLYVGEFRYVR